MMQDKRRFFLIVVLAALFGAHAVAGIQLSVNIAPPPIAVFDLSWRWVHMDTWLLSIR